MRFPTLVLFLILALNSHAQTTVSGTLTNSQGHPLQGAHVHLGSSETATDARGQFVLQTQNQKSNRLTLSHPGYHSKDTLIQLKPSVKLQITLHQTSKELDELVIGINSQPIQTKNQEKVSQKYITDNYAGSFAKSLENLAGVNASSIGAGQSKPIIRGLGLNRVAVSENGVKQEGQQWGADHGLEIDAFNTEKVNIIKGAAAIAYGSDAMAGVIQIDNNAAPKDTVIRGRVTALYASVNQSVGANVHLKQRINSFYYKFNATYIDYADYKVPTNQIKYLNTLLPIYDHHVKNTAGRDQNMALQLGFEQQHYKTVLNISNNQTKAGFFPGAHGVPSVSAVAPDGNHRNIDFPFQEVNHLKVINEHVLFFKNSQLAFNLGYQNNHRQEWSAFHTHYSNQNAPLKNPDLELDFVLQTLDQTATYTQHWNEAHQTKVGAVYQYQYNRSKGYSYLLPNYDKKSAAAFLIHEYQVNDKLHLEGGIRADQSNIKVASYFDTTLYDYLIGIGKSTAIANYYANRTPAINKDFHAFNASVGLGMDVAPHWQWSLNMGTNFRIPTAIELGANGIHHGAFRHEQGDANLNPEKGWVIDSKITYDQHRWKVDFSPYLYYFDNYLYLKPSGQFSILPHGGQIYQYAQSKAMLTGFELAAAKNFGEHWSASAILEFIYNSQRSGNAATNYPLPFTPANNVFAKVNYQFNQTRFIPKSSVYLQGKWVAKQERIAQNEAITPGYQTYGAGAQAQFQWGSFQWNATLQISNITDAKYYNHSSFYRAIELPELGRNIQLTVQIPF